jgi:hypothetical protein
MKKRKSQGKSSKREKVDDIRSFFLACEFKPNSDLFSVLDPFAYDIKPAFIHGSLGIVAYEPEAYAIVDADEKSPPLMGYIMTITHPDTILLLDKIKGVNGPTGFNYHTKKLVHVYTDIDVVQNAWIYILSESALDAYEQIEQVEFGLWDEEDEQQISFLEKMGDGM